MASVFANGRSIVHAGDGQTNVSGPPDVCKTPSPGGPVPVPYVNVAKTSDLAKGSKSVKIEGHSIALEHSYLSTSTGDEPGTAGGGLISGKTKGKLTWGSSSPDVKIEGKGVVRFGDVTQHNGNTFNTALVQAGVTGTGMVYGDDRKCIFCDKPPKKHEKLEVNENAAQCMTKLVDQLNEKFDGQRAQWLARA